jgi:hypothetical protein
MIGAMGMDLICLMGSFLGLAGLGAWGARNGSIG